MTAQHTPGPWKHDPATSFQHSPTISAGNLKIATAWMGQMHPLNVDAHIPIPGEANAALMAAAPDMLAALEGNAVLLNALLAAHEAEPFREHMDPAKRFQNDLRNQTALTVAAIAKARGQK